MDFDDTSSDSNAAEAKQACTVEPGRRLDCADGSVIIKGIRLPSIVVRQLEALGSPLEVYSVGQLEDAIAAVETDGSLIDDDEGETFEDKLHLSDQERHEREERKERRQAYRLRNATLFKSLFSDISDPTPEQIHNPWRTVGAREASETDVADDFEIVHFGHEHLFKSIEPSPELTMTQVISYEWGFDKDGHPIIHRFFE